MRAKHERVDDPNERDRIESILEDNDEATVDSIDQKQWTDDPPAPLNLPWAQQKFKGSPSKVLEDLQYLYNEGYATYPRTESQRYGPDFDYAEKVLALGVGSPLDVPDLNGNFDPTEGSSRDSAHPPITPTTNVPDLGEMDDWKRDSWVRVARHFLATLMDPAVKQKTTYTLLVDGEPFTIERKEMVEMGYFDVYGPYKRVYNDSELDVSEGDVLDIEDWEMDERQTDPPELWSQSDAIDQMEKAGIGTSATRASMIDKLFDRSYIDSDDGIYSQRLGGQIVDAMEEYAPRLTDPNWTAELQQNLEDLKSGDADLDDVISEAREWVADSCIQIKQKEQEIGREIVHIEDGCPECGGDLWLRDGKYGAFYGCEEYPDCQHTE